MNCMHGKHISGECSECDEITEANSIKDITINETLKNRILYLEEELKSQTTKTKEFIHDLNNIMTAVYGYADLAANKSLPVEDCLKTITDTKDRYNKLIEGMKGGE